MIKSKIIHARIDEKTHDLLFEKCNSIGCTFTEYIQTVILESLAEKETNKNRSEIIVEDVTEHPKPIVTIIHE